MEQIAYQRESDFVKNISLGCLLIKHVYETELKTNLTLMLLTFKSALKFFPRNIGFAGGGRSQLDRGV